MKAGVFVALGLGLAMTTTAMPAQAYLAKGLGKCSTWVGGVDDRSWILGFITGYNFAQNAQIGKDATADDIFKFVSKYCKTQPEDDLADAATAYVKTQ